MKKISAYLMALLYCIAGAFHFISPQYYEQIMPAFVPVHTFIIYVSGVFEILFGLLLIPMRTRRFAAICIIVLLILIFPANIQMTINYYRAHNPNLWLTIVRLPLQIVLLL